MDGMNYGEGGAGGGRERGRDGNGEKMRVREVE